MPFSAPVEYPAIIIPSITLKGNDSRIILSMNAPGSPSSPLQTTYFGFCCDAEDISHFLPVGNPAPPRPRRPLSKTVLITEAGSEELRHFLRALNPSRRTYSL